MLNRVVLRSRFVFCSSIVLIVYLYYKKPDCAIALINQDELG
ncbi:MULTISPECIES: hypothetical protein [unclassified Tolypothrix]|nr:MULTISPECIES: hypothetical protein [unclassified Tolypothrix]